MRNRRNRLFIGILIVFGMALAAVFYEVSHDLDTRYREASEETLVDTTYLLASMLATDVSDSQSALSTSRIEPIFNALKTIQFNATIYTTKKQHVDLRAYVTDKNGIVTFDSLQQNVGKDFSRWHDISRVLAGHYGARTTRDQPDDIATAVMYVAAPIKHNGQLIGVVSVGKPIAALNDFVLSARQKLISVAIITLLFFIVLLVVIVVWLARPFGLTADLWRIVKQEGLRHPKRLWARIKIVLSATYHDMQDAIAGRSYTETYVQNLTHEIKSPLTAIRCAAELLNEPMPLTQSQRFTHNIIEQVKRLEDMVNKLLELASLEKQRVITVPQPVPMNALIADTIHGLSSTADSRGIKLIVAYSTANFIVFGDAFLLQRALTNLITNAIDFSPEHTEVHIDFSLLADKLHLRVRDVGDGIPDYAIDHVFEKFYSRPHPNSKQKSSGLGLAFVREIAELHSGQVYLENHAGGGAIATLVLPARLA